MRILKGSFIDIFGNNILLFFFSSPHFLFGTFLGKFSIEIDKYNYNKMKNKLTLFLEEKRKIGVKIYIFMINGVLGVCQML